MHPLPHIRFATESDAAILCAAEREIARTPGRLVSQPGELHESAFTEKIRALAGTGCYLVAQRDTTIVGHASLEPMAPLQSLEHVFTLTMVVHPGYSAQGIGTVLMQALQAWARAAPQLQKIELRVRAENAAALRLYRQAGFIEEGRFEQRIRLPDGRYIADISMAWFPVRGGQT